MQLRLLYLIVLIAPLLGGCGGDDALAPTTPSGPPATIEAIVRDAYGAPARRVEVRLLADPKTEIIPSGDGNAMLNTEPARPSVEGANMILVKKLKTDDYGKFRMPDVTPGKYLLSAGVPQSGFSRQWVEVQAGQTLTPTIKLVR